MAAATVLGTGARALSPGKWLWLGAGAAVVAAAVVTTVVVTQSSDSPAAGGQAAAEEGEPGGGPAGGVGPAAGSASAAPEELPPTGDYTLTYTVTSAGGVGYEPVGFSSSAPWNGIELECSGNTCSGAVPFDDGDGDATFDGETLQVTGTSQAVVPCHDLETGEVVEGSTATLGVAFTAVATVSSRAEDGRPVLTGTMQVNWTQLATTGGCKTEPPDTTTRDITLTPA